MANMENYVYRRPQGVGFHLVRRGSSAGRQQRGDGVT